MIDRRPYRQGDVLLIPTDESLPSGAHLIGTGLAVLALGETTGHAHVVEAPGVELYETAAAADRWLRVRTPARETHEEHPAILLPPGLYRVRLRREYTPEAVRRVAD